MSNNNNHLIDFGRAVAPWIRGRQISVYLRGRDKPMTGLTVCAVYPSVIVARWNSSTHLIPIVAIVAIRFAPDCDPVRDRDHQLHTNVSLKRDVQQRRDAPRPTDLQKKKHAKGPDAAPQAEPRPYPVPADTPPDDLQADRSFISGGRLVHDVLARMAKGAGIRIPAHSGSPTRDDRDTQRVNTPPASEKLEKGQKP